MWRACVSTIRIYGPSVAAFGLILLLAGVLIERRLLTPHLMVDASLPTASTPAPFPPDLRRIVLDPCTGLEKANVAAIAAKAD